MYHISICDDDEIFCVYLEEILRKALKEIQIDYSVEVYNDPSQLICDIKAQKHYNLIILDILMNDVNGIDIGKKLRELGIKSSILFITSSKDYSYEGYSVHPIHYLLKPIDKAELKEVIKKDYYEQFMAKRIILSYYNEKRIIEINHINYIESLNKKAIVHTEKEEVIITNTLQELLKKLPENIFIRCHKSFILNMNKISTFSRANFILQNEEKIPSGRAYYYEAVKKFMEYLGDLS